MPRRLALVLALLGPVLLGSGLLRLAHDEVSHSRWAVGTPMCCQTGDLATPEHGAPSHEPRREPPRHDGKECPLCALLASLASEPPHLNPAGIVAAPTRVAPVPEPDGRWGSIGRVHRLAARGPPSTL